MGWLWTDSSAKKAARNDDLTEQNHTPSTAEETNFPPPEPQTSKGKQADTELELMLQEFQTPSSRQASYKHQTSSPSQPDTPFESDLPVPRDWQPSILHPTSMSCTSAFDQAMYCQIIGGQFVNYYRYGTLRNCGELWSNFWFCMRTNRGFMSDEEREKRIQAFYMAREARLKAGGSSEDVWEGRKEDDVRAWAREQFRWDLRRFEKGEAVLREER